MVEAIWIVPLFPLAGALLMLFVGKHLPKLLINAICVGSVLLAFLVSLSAVLANGGAVREVVLFQWLPLLQVDWGYLLDPLSSVMILVVTGIGTLIHLYSVGYMAGEQGYYRFFGYLNLFVFFMLTLVLANNFALMFVGWEGVGLCSYLLIGFYFQRKSASDAGMKAFLVNRLGDWAFVLGILLIWSLLGTLKFTNLPAALQTSVPETTFGVLSLATLLLFIGAAGKSAQFPLHVWLPDAMEGPTPVSALIHAATMVTAGVYMIARANAIFQLTPVTLSIIAAIGALTAILAASIAMVQHDIKRILAYSTVSQLGFMFMALGCGAYWVAVFHLFTHAFFKALLFLGAGSVIHGMSGEQDIRKMGGLRKFMPVTFATMLIGSLAIAGIPGLAGFFSKEAILTNAFVTSKSVYAVGLITAGMTAYYMWRLMRQTFWGELKTPAAHPHESPLPMTLPLIALAAGSVLAGWTHLAFQDFLSPLFPAEQPHGIDRPAGYALMAIAVGAALIGIFLSRFSIGGPIATLLGRKFYIDELYSAFFVEGFAKRGGLLLGSFDRNVVDGSVNGAAWLTRLQSRILIFWDTWVIDGLVRLASGAITVASYPVRLLQSGRVQSYALFLVLGALAMFGVYVTRP
ncbi:MAG: NADH-quinone oxidoreductase subunit L [Bryobacteraceae bacterium]